MQRENVKSVDADPAGKLMHPQIEHLVRGLVIVSPPQLYRLSGSPMLQ